MNYKLILYGTKEAFALVLLPNPFPPKPNDVFIYKQKRYLVLSALFVAKEISFDKDGHQKTEKYNSDTGIPELIVTELPDL